MKKPSGLSEGNARGKDYGVGVKGYVQLIDKEE